MTALKSAAASAASGQVAWSCAASSIAFSQAALNFASHLAIESPYFAVSLVEASAFVDPSTCDQSGLRYQWRITYIQVDGSEVSPFTDRGITGYITPKLTIKANAMPAGNAYVDLKVTSGAHPDQFMLVRFFFTVDSTSRVLISYYLQCKATNTLCNRLDPGCLCFFSSLLPTTEPTS